MRNEVPSDHMACAKLHVTANAAACLAGARALSEPAAGGVPPALMHPQEEVARGLSKGSTYIEAC